MSWPKFSAAFLLAFPLAATAEPSLESLYAASELRPPALSPFVASDRSPYAAPPHRRAPGRITGDMGRGPVDLALDRQKGRITGVLNLADVDLTVDSRHQTIQGTANGGRVDLKFTGTLEHSVYEGTAYGRPIRLDVDYLGAKLDGYANGSPVHLDFDIMKGTARGYANQAPVQLSYNPETARLRGIVNHAPVNAVLERLFIYDVLDNFYLFLKP